MSQSEKQYSERDMVMAKRDAWVACFMDGVRVDRDSMRSEAIRQARARYPLTETRPRVVTDMTFGTHWWIMPDELLPRGSANIGDTRTRQGTYADTQCAAWMITPERIRIWADLLANPSETVNCDG